MSKLVYAISRIGEGNMSYKYGSEEDVTNNRQKFLDKNNIKLEDCVATFLRGTDEVQIVSKSDTGKVIEVDALITNDLGVGLFMCAADCFPVIIHDPQRHALALVHLGRAGIGKKLIQKVIKLMNQQFNSIASNLQVTIGAGIRKDSYIYDKIPDPGWKPYLEKLADGKISIDMTKYLLEQLSQSGVVRANISDEGIDTFTNKEYFSHRRSVVNGESDGRFGIVAIIT